MEIYLDSINEYLHKFICKNSEGKIIGQLQVVFRNYDGIIDRDFYNNRPYVVWSHVKPEFRRQGVASSLYLFVAKYFNDMGYRLYSSDNMSI